MVKTFLTNTLNLFSCVTVEAVTQEDVRTCFWSFSVPSAASFDGTRYRTVAVRFRWSACFSHGVPLEWIGKQRVQPGSQTLTAVIVVNIVHGTQRNVPWLAFSVCTHAFSSSAPCRRFPDRREENRASSTDRLFPSAAILTKDPGGFLGRCL